MAAPSATPRGTPAGLPLRDGFGTMVTFANVATLSVWEMETTPPGKDGGPPIDTTTFHNTARRTKSPRQLIEDTVGSMTVAYDPNVESDLEAQINVNQVITVTWIDGSTKAFYGWMSKFTPQAHTDGEMPQATVEFECSNIDTSFAEQAPVVVSVAGS